MGKLSVFVDLGKTRSIAKIVKLNDYTVWVDIVIGCSTHIIIKRHIKKHHCFFFTLGGYHIDDVAFAYNKGGFLNETIHSTIGD